MSEKTALFHLDSIDQRGHCTIEEYVGISDALDEITRLQSEVERLRGRCGELEEVAKELLNDCINFDGGKLSDCILEKASDTLMRPSLGWLLRKQADAVEALRDSIKEQYPLEPFGDLDEYVIAGMKEVYTYVEKSAQRLRQQAAEIEGGEG